MTRIMCNTFVLLVGHVFNLFSMGECWRAIPANQAMYALRSTDTGVDTTNELPDVLLPRDRLNYVYKFGWCRADVISPNFIRKTVNMTLPTLKDQQATYLYLVEDMVTRRYAFQCIVMKAYVNRKYLFYKSRLPLYYCQGYVISLVLVTVTRYAIHEFYLHNKLSMPISFVIEFYQAPPL